MFKFGTCYYNCDSVSDRYEQSGQYYLTCFELWVQRPGEIKTVCLATESGRRFCCNTLLFLATRYICYFDTPKKIHMLKTLENRVSYYSFAFCLFNLKVRYWLIAGGTNFRVNFRATFCDHTDTVGNIFSRNGSYNIYKLNIDITIR